MTGQKARSGRKPKTYAEHIRDGTYIHSKHAHLKPTAVLMRKPAPGTKGRQRYASRWIRGKADELAVSTGCYFDERAAAYVVEWVAKYCRHCKGRWAGEPFELLPWQRDEIIYPLFGWKRQDGRRRFQVSYIQVPKKNGKSALASTVGLYMLVGDGEAGAKVFSTATDRDQASLVHGEAIAMVQASPELSQHLTINHTTRAIIHATSGSSYLAKSSVAKYAEGWDASCIIVDELHAWNDRQLWDALKYAGRARENPLRFVITTAGDDEESVCYEQYEYAKDVIAGRVHDDRYFAYVLEMEKGDDYHDPKVWAAVNPSFGVTIDAQTFAADLKEAGRIPSTLNNFLRYSFNRWSSAISQAIPLEKWKECGRRYAEEDLKGQPCWGGLDLSQTTDSTALVLVFKVDDLVCALPYFWMTEEAVGRAVNRDELLDWAERGLLHIVSGGVIDYQLVIRELARLKKLFRLKVIAYDKMYAEPTTQEMESKLGLKRLEFPQTMMHFAGPWAELERAILGGTLRHNSHPLLTRQLSHARIKTDASGNKRPVRGKAGDGKPVDGVVSLVMALGAMMHLTARHGPGVYGRRGVIAV